MNLMPRAAAMAIPLTLTLTLAAATVASAQVASLAAPDETPEPEAAEAVLEFADREEALLAFAQCMRDHGVDMDDPTADSRGRGFFRGPGGSGEGGIDRFGEEFQVAQQACGDILEASRPDVDPELQEERLESELLMAQCFRDSGYPDYPDPSIGSDGRLQRGGQAFADLGIDRRSEAFQETRATCTEQLGLEDLVGPGGGPGALGGGS